MRLTDRIQQGLILMLATGLGAGCAPFVPGTVGSLWGVPLTWALLQLPLNLGLYLLVAGILVLLGVPICTRAAQVYGEPDPGQIVLDEILAFPFIFVCVPLTVPSGIVGFVWFRLFDILKPWPASRLERLPAGWGVMADDVAAALYARAALWGTMELLRVV